ncbi:hypothetical protein [Streptomyces sp. NBC_00425]|uniref:hypothetical protein n=1 Tax=Streptomyces sp. NBC_00425 TaxID=2975740 RepID=UPI002E209C91
MSENGFCERIQVRWLSGARLTGTADGAWRGDFVRALRAEWTKLRTAGEVGRLLLLAVALTVAVGCGTAKAVKCPDAGCGQDAVRLALTGVTVGQAVVAVLGIVLGLLYLVPVVTRVVNDLEWQRHLQQISPMTAGLAIQATVNLQELPIGPWAGPGVLATWAAAALLVGSLLLHRRDAQPNRAVREPGGQSRSGRRSSTHRQFVTSAC